MGLFDKILKPKTTSNTSQSNINQNIQDRSPNRQDKNLLFAAVKGSNADIDSSIQKGAYINTQDEKGNTALILATSNRHYGSVELLIKHGADVNIQNKHDSTALMEASSNKYKEIVDLLIKNGAKVNIKDKSGRSALFFGIDNMDVTKMLIAAGADVNVQFEMHKIATAQKGICSLLCFVLNHKYDKELVNLLIKNGATLYTKNEYGSSALELLIQNGYYNIVESLIKNGMDLSSYCVREFNLLTSAAAKGHKEIVDMLIKSGADIDSQNDIGNTALINAAISGHMEIVDMLIKSGANINAVSDYGVTALIGAANNGHRDVVKLLLAKDAELSIKSSVGTAINIAAKKGHKDIVSMIRIELLAKYGSSYDVQKEYDDDVLKDIVRGNFGEPYCTEQCHKLAKERLNSFLFKNGRSMVCSVCQKPGIVEWNSHVMIYENKIVYACSPPCEFKVELDLKSKGYNKCCHCGINLYKYINGKGLPIVEEEKRIFDLITTRYGKGNEFKARDIFNLISKEYRDWYIEEANKRKVYAINWNETAALEILELLRSKGILSRHKEVTNEVYGDEEWYYTLL